MEIERITMAYFALGVPAPLRSAVGLSAISLLAMFPSRFSKSDLGTSTGSVTSSPFPKLVPVPLAKDAAPIPNAKGYE